MTLCLRATYLKKILAKKSIATQLKRIFQDTLGLWLRNQNWMFVQICAILDRRCAQVQKNLKYLTYQPNCTQMHLQSDQKNLTDIPTWSAFMYLCHLCIYQRYFLVLSLITCYPFQNVSCPTFHISHIHHYIYPNLVLLYIMKMKALIPLV